MLPLVILPVILDYRSLVVIALMSRPSHYPPGCTSYTKMVELEAVASWRMGNPSNQDDVHVQVRSIIESDLADPLRDAQRSGSADKAGGSRGLRAGPSTALRLLHNPAFRQQLKRLV